MNNLSCAICGSTTNNHDWKKCEQDKLIYSILSNILEEIKGIRNDLYQRS